MRSIATASLFAVVLVLASPAGAIVVGDYIGYGYETGGFLPSDAGDELVFTAVATAANPVTGADLGIQEMTFYAYGLISDGQTVDSSGNTTVNYTGGKLKVYLDGSQNADWGTNPPNTTSPSTFSDGALLFEGDFTNFVIVIQADGAGAYEGNLDGVAGTLLDSTCSECGYTWGGAWTTDAGAQTIDGYDLQIDGKFDLLEAVPTETDSWGAVKSTFQR